VEIANHESNHIQSSHKSQQYYFDRQKFVLAVDQALKEQDKDKDTVGDSGHNMR